MKIVSVVGARPQFIKAAPLLRALAARHDVVAVHTGQHYDDNMSAVFFRELGMADPDLHLGVGSGSHARQTAAMIERLEPVLEQQRPDGVIVYGDTNTTLAAAVAAAKLVIPIAHVEAGLRSFNRSMPEEQNRVVADHLSRLLFCPTETAVRNLAAESIQSGVHLVGDVMEEALLEAVDRARQQSDVLERLGVSDGQYALATVHRAENTENIGRLQRILEAFSQLRERAIFPMHPRTKAAVAKLGWSPPSNVTIVEPQGYLDMVRLESSAAVILTDSGGVQKEAFWLGVPCVTLRDETEWTETLSDGRNVLAGAATDRIVALTRSAIAAGRTAMRSGAGERPSQRMAAIIGRTW